MKEKINIRKALKSDFDQIHELVKQIHMIHLKERSDLYKNVDPLEFQEYEKELIDPNNIYIVAEIKEKIVGICFASIMESDGSKVMKKRKFIYIKNICVDEKYRRNKIGENLYKYIFYLGKKRKLDGIELTVWGFNEKAIKFYEKNGMKVKNIKYEYLY